MQLHKKFPDLGLSTELEAFNTTVNKDRILVDNYFKMVSTL